MVGGKREFKMVGKWGTVQVFQDKLIRRWEQESSLAGDSREEYKKGSGEWDAG